MMVTYCMNQKRAISSTLLLLLIVNVLTSCVVSETYDHHDNEDISIKHSLEDGINNNNVRKRNRRMNSEENNHANVRADEIESGRRNLQSAAYFTTTALGDRNYNASYGNPMKGLAGASWSPSSKIDHSLEFTYAGLNSVLKDFDTYDWSDFEWQLSATASRNRQLVPRFFIVYPPHPPNLPASILKSIKTAYYYDYGTAISPIFDDPVLLGVLEKFIAAYGAKYDGDKRIAYVQAGLVGFWGEYHTLGSPFLSQATKDSVTTWFKNAFKTTPVMVRYPSATTKALNVGYHDDSYTKETLDGIYEGDASSWRNYYFWPSIKNVGHSDVWRFSPIGGETCVCNINSVLTQSYPAGTRNKQDFWACAQVTHTVYMKHGHFGDDYSLQKGIMIHTNMGYNYQLRQVSASLKTTTVPRTIDVNVTVEQIGYTPFYYPLSIAFKCKGAIIQTVPGVEKLIDQYQTGVFTFRNIAIDSSCLSSVQFTLESNNLLPTRPMKWAQGTTGIVTISIPLPPGESSVPTSVVVLPPPVPRPVSVIAPIPLPVAPVPVPVSSVDFRYYLVNADTNNDIGQIFDNQVFSFASLGTRSLSVRFEAPSSTSSMSVSLTDASGTTARDEAAAPWLLGGNSGPDVYPVASLATVGTKTITANAKSSSGAIFLTRSVKLVLVDTAPVAPVPVGAPLPVPTMSGDMRYYLVNADTNNDISQFVDNQVFKFASLGTRSLSVRFEPPSTTSVMTVSWTGASGGTTTRDERGSLWAMGGHSGSDITPVGALATAGTTTITVNAKSSTGAVFLTISIKLILVD